MRWSELSSPGFSNLVDGKPSPGKISLDLALRGAATMTPLIAAVFVQAALHALRPARCDLQRTLWPLQRCDAPCACAGELAGPFWDALTEEAEAEAEALGLTICELSFASGTLSVSASGGSVDELQQLNSHLSQFIDARAEDEEVASLPPFLLQVSSPGLGSQLTSDLDFASFKGFPVVVTTTEPFKKKTQWEGTLIGRDDAHVSINLKGRPQKIPRELVQDVSMPEAKTEPGDMLAT